MKPIAWYDPTNGMVSTDKDSPLFTPLGQVLPLYTKKEDDGITLTNIRHPRGKPALGDLNPESLETVEIDLPEQEPVGYASEGAAERLTTVKKAHEQIRSFRLFTHDVPLYTSPPQRTWVSPTDKEIEAIWEKAMFADYGVGAELSNQPFVHYARAIEAKLKKKNT